MEECAEAVPMPIPRSDDGAHATEWNDFDSLIMRARQAHDVEVRRLENEVQSLRQRLEAVCGDRQSLCANGLAKRADLPVDPEMIHIGTEESVPNPKVSPGVLFDVYEGPADIPVRQPRYGEQLDKPASLPLRPPRQSDNLGANVDAAVRPSSRSEFSDFQARSLSRIHTNTKGTEESVNFLSRLVAHPGFEVFICTIIILNGAVLAAEAQYQGFDLAVRTGHDSAGGVSSDVWPHGEAFFQACEWTFGIIYLFEVVVKILAERREFVRDFWNLFDLALVVFWLSLPL
ncbi:unnamed protein product [Prorocentrum cordatum]|uniref:Ion transport domain-containing protein n=1 Tax=Prorocentrum cordatum TaxID=2364126 RepID=A0ABN9RMQ5_9DINO|nr:unnamed protein product [Polarella glacialis]